MEEVLTKTEHPNFDTVWAVLQDVAERQRETDRIMKETNKKIGRLGNSLGDIIEYQVMPCALEKFRKHGFIFTKAYPHAFIKDEKNNIVTEVDITLENGDKVMLIDVKVKLKSDDIDEHIERIKKVKTHAGLRGDKRLLLGAVAGMVISDSERNYAMKNGLYVIEPSGESFTIAAPKGNYTPREW